MGQALAVVPYYSWYPPTLGSCPTGRARVAVPNWLCLGLALPQGLCLWRSPEHRPPNLLTLDILSVSDPLGLGVGTVAMCA